MFTSRAEHRLLLREDNADRRLAGLAHEIGVSSAEDAERASARATALDRTRELLTAFRLFPSAETNAALVALGLAPLRQPMTAADLLRRPEVDWNHLVALGVAAADDDTWARATLVLDLKYEGYVVRQEAIVGQAARLESTVLPHGIDFTTIDGLSAEAREKLSRVQPRTLGQAARIPGITPAAISLLGVHLRRARSA
jgi:tRNA uridine 5-carboxymethylaminomethyl modification enzyme